MAGPTERLFVAVWPPPAVLDLLEALPRPPVRGVRYTRRDQWHVTLRFLGDADAGEIDRRLQSIRIEPPVARLGPSVVRLGRGVLAVPVEGLDALAAAVREATADLGEPPDPRPFSGHLTIARLRGRSVGAVLGAPVEAGFRVDAVHLVRSELLPEGPRYTMQSSVPLRDGGP